MLTLKFIHSLQINAAFFPNISYQVKISQIFVIILLYQ